MPLDLTVVTPEGQAFHGEADCVVLPGVEGDFGILSGHEVFMTSLQPGTMQIEQGGDTKVAAVSKGSAEVHEDQVTVMVGSCEFADEIDVERARIAAERAKRQLDEMRTTEDGEALYQEYHDAYCRAVARLAASEKRKS